MEYHLYLLGSVLWFLLIYSLSVGLCPVIAPLKAILLIYYYLEIASSTLFPPFFLLSYIFSNLFIIYQICLFVSILEIFYDTLNQTHILWVTFSIDNQFSIQILCHQTLFYMEQWDDLLYSLAFHLVKYF